MESRNLILAIALSLCVLLGWQYLTDGPRQRAALKRQEESSQSTPAPSADAAKPALSQQQGVEALQDRPAALAESPRVAIETPKLLGSFALKGGRIDDLRLAAYHDTVDPHSPEVVLLSPKGGPDAYFAEFGWAAANGAEMKLPGPDTLWTVVDGQRLTPETPVTLTYDNGDGLLFTRKISVDANYLFTILDTVKNTGSTARMLFPWGRIARYGTPRLSGAWVLFEGMLGVFEGTLDEVKYKTVVEDKRIEKTSTGGWMGITDKYWLTALLPPDGQKLTASFNHNRPGGLDLYQADYLETARDIAPGDEATMTGRLFAGAKEVVVIDRYETEQNVKLFDRAIDWGWLYFLTKPIFLLLDWFYSLVGNFGIAILLFTLVVKGAFFPLANRQYEMTSKQKKLQPEIKKLQERYKDDKLKLQQEMMELYKREKANPLSGCLPLLLQLPVFWALYKVLYVTIEMRHAPFFGWIHDLSEPDPSNIFNLFGLIPWDPPLALHFGAWPLVMGATIFMLQKLSPPPPDPTQAKILGMMPLIMMISMAQVSAGLLIYWSWSNLLSMLQQMLIMYRMGVPIAWGKRS